MLGQQRGVVRDAATVRIGWADDRYLHGEAVYGGCATLVKRTQGPVNVDKIAFFLE